MDSSYAVRRPTRRDAGSLVAVARDCQIADFGTLFMTDEDLSIGFGLLDLARDVWLVEDGGGEAVAYAGVRAAPPARISAFAGVLPPHRGRGIGARLVELIEQRAGEIASRAAGEEATVSQPIAPANDGARRLLKQRGYERVRSFWQMEIALQRRPPALDPPAGIEIETLTPGDDRRVYEAMQEAFQDHWNFTPRPYEQWRAWNVDRPSFDPSLWLLAVDGDEIAGASLCAARDDAGWVNVLGVRRRWRRRGVGLALLHESFHRLYERGFRRVGLDVDAANPTGATRLYERAGMRVAQESETYQKTLSTGPEGPSPAD